MSVYHFVAGGLFLSALIMAACAAILMRGRERIPITWTYWYSCAMACVCFVLAIVYLRR